MGRAEKDAAVERIARAMAAHSGIVWDRLDYYPGYVRGRCRDDARSLLEALTRPIPPEG